MLDPDWLVDLFTPFGATKVRRFFGGQGVYLDGLMIGLVAGGVLYFKCDGQTAPAFEAEGLAPFSYSAKGARRVVTSYRRAPAAALDDPDELRPWIALARAAAMRAMAGKEKGRAPRRRRGPAGGDM